MLSLPTVSLLAYLSILRPSFLMRRINCIFASFYNIVNIVYAILQLAIKNIGLLQIKIYAMILIA